MGAGNATGGAFTQVRQPPALKPDPNHADDVRARDRILGGDRAVAEAVYERHVDSLYEFCFYRVGRDHAQCEDVVQDTFLVAFDKLVDFDGRSSFHTWLCGIAKNKIRAARRKLRPMRMEDVLARTDAEIDAILADVENQPLPDDVLEAAEVRELVGATLSSLPPAYRDALVDKYVDGKSVPEMAREAGKGIKAVESTVHRARGAFSRVFQLLARRRGGLA